MTMALGGWFRKVAQRCGPNQRFRWEIIPIPVGPRFPRLTKYSLEAEVPAPTCEVAIDGCETGIEYEASVVDDICKLCLLQQLLCSLWLWIMHSNNT